MDDFKSAVAKTLPHMLEVGFVGLAMVGAFYFFGDDPEIQSAIKQLLLVVFTTATASGVPKLARSWDKIPVADYVNDKE